jgi:DNA-binding NarL/FixJ family response regulator
VNPVAIRILLVEDDALFRGTLGDWLERAGFHVWRAPEGASALKLLREQVVDVVVTDLAMPEFGGLQLLDAICEEFPGLQVVFLTGQATLEVAIAALREGRAFDFVRKPLRDLSGFRQTIERAAHRTQDRRREVTRRVPEEVPLPERDLDILRLLGAGLENQAIAERLSLSEKTVRNRLSQLYDRVGVENRTQAVLLGRERGWI